MKPESHHKQLLNPSWIERDFSNRQASRVEALSTSPVAPKNCSLFAREAARND